MAEAVKPAPQIDPTVAADLARLALDLSHNKETRREFGRLVKKAKPDSPHAAAFNDIDIEDKFEAFTAKQEADKLEQQRASVLARMNQQRAALLTGGSDGSGRKYSEDDVKAIEALMQKKGVSDYDDGAILYAATLPPENPKPSQVPKPSATWEFPEMEKFGKDLTPAGLARTSRDMAFDVINEFQRKRA
jgi:hypothetical protein